MTHRNVDLLKLYAHEHCLAGGHWIAESCCWDTADYVQLLYRCKNNLAEAKLELRAHWEQINEQELAHEAAMFAEPWE